MQVSQSVQEDRSIGSSIGCSAKLWNDACRSGRATPGFLHAALLVNQELGLGASSIELPDAAHCFDRMFLAVTHLKRLQQKVVAVVTVAAGFRVG